MCYLHTAVTRGGDLLPTRRPCLFLGQTRRIEDILSAHDSSGFWKLVLSDGRWAYEYIDVLAHRRVLSLFQAIAEYSGCRKEQPHIKLFWQALREFTPHERSMLIKFTWGR